MPWNGAGTFTLNQDFVTDASSGSPANIISATKVDNELQNIKSGLENCLTLTGETTATADISMGGYHFTSVAQGANKTDSTNIEQVTNGILNYAGTLGGTATTITATVSTLSTSLAAGMVIRALVGSTTTGAATLNVNGGGAVTLQNWDGSAIAADDFQAGDYVEIRYDGTNWHIKELQTRIAATEPTYQLSSVAGTDTITASTAITLTALNSGSMFVLTAAGTNTGATTLNIDSIGATAVVDGAGSALSGGEIVSGSTYVLHYNGTHFRVVGGGAGATADMDQATYDPAGVSEQLVGLTAAQTLTNKTLTSPVISSISNTGTLTLPTSSDTLVGRATTDTLTNKTLTTPVISSISNTGTLTLPTSTDTLVGRATTDTLTNKTLTTPVISSISNTGTLTLPTSTDTLVGRATTDTLTNKTFDANGTGNSLSNVDVADLANGTDGELITWDAAGAPATVGVGTSGQVLTSNGAGAAPTFQDASGGGTMPTVQVFTSSGTWTKPTDCQLVKVTVQGGGGGSGGIDANCGNGRSGGGGGGGCAIKWIDVTAISSETVTIGAGGTAGNGGPSETDGGDGGDSTFGAHCTGGGGSGSDAVSNGGTTGGASGGTASSGDVNIPGGNGGDGDNAGGHGGVAFMSSGGSLDGEQDGKVYGGGADGEESTSDNDGHAGAAGIIIVEEFY